MRTNIKTKSTKSRGKETRSPISAPEPTAVEIQHAVKLQARRSARPSCIEAVVFAH